MACKGRRHSSMAANALHPCNNIHNSACQIPHSNNRNNSNSLCGNKIQAWNNRNSAIIQHNRKGAHNNSFGRNSQPEIWDGALPHPPDNIRAAHGSRHIRSKRQHDRGNKQMNLEETQKVNRLTKELMAHHIVETWEEATSRAEEMLLDKEGVKEKAKQEQAQLENHEIRNLNNTV